MPSYYRVMLGQGSIYADKCFEEGFIGVDYEITRDLTKNLPDDWYKFNKEFIPVWLEGHPGKSKIAAGLSCGFLWTVAKGIQKGDVVLSPTGMGTYRACEVTGDYCYVPDGPLPHRRPVHWQDQPIDKAQMSPALKGSAGSIGGVANISQYADEIKLLMVGATPPPLVATDPSIEDPATFALEKHLEDFLVSNWPKTEFGADYAVFAEDGANGQQYPTDTGSIVRAM